MNPDPFWLPKSDAARLCGLSVRQFSDVVPPRLKPEATTGEGAKLRFDAAAVVAAFVAYKLEQAKPIDGDPLMGADSGDSPELARYRRLKGDEVELNLAERRAVLVAADKVMASLGPALSAMRGTGDRLARQFGNEAADIFNEGIAEFEAAAKRMASDAEQPLRE